MEAGDTILNEANAKLRAAVRNKDFKEVSVVQVIFKLQERRSVVLTKRCSRQGSNSSLFQNENRPS